MHHCVAQSFLPLGDLHMLQNDTGESTCHIKCFQTKSGALPAYLSWNSPILTLQHLMVIKIVYAVLYAMALFQPIDYYPHTQCSKPFIDFKIVYAAL